MQAAIVRWARNHADLYPPLRWLFAVPNGGHRDAAEAANLKREGVTPGISDLCLLYDNGEHAALWMELKIGANKPTEAQLDFQAWAESQGHRAVVCRTTQDAILMLREYLGIDDPADLLTAEACLAEPGEDRSDLIAVGDSGRRLSSPHHNGRVLRGIE